MSAVLKPTGHSMIEKEYQPMIEKEYQHLGSRMT